MLSLFQPFLLGFPQNWFSEVLRILGVIDRRILLKKHMNLNLFNILKHTIFIVLMLFFVTNCKPKPNQSNIEKIKKEVPIISIAYDTIKFTNGFDFPVGKPDAEGYYNAQKFTENNHLGDDWNGKGGGNTDLNDPVYAIANGYVVFAENINGGWGNVIRIVHYVNKTTRVESLYAHCHLINIKKGDYVRKGQNIGTIGNNNGQYLAHLHLELRDEVGLPIGGGYAANTEGFLDPTEFIKNHRN